VSASDKVSDEHVEISECQNTVKIKVRNCVFNMLLISSSFKSVISRGNISIITLVQEVCI
jgi:hypothetical protein